MHHDVACGKARAVLGANVRHRDLSGRRSRSVVGADSAHRQLPCRKIYSPRRVSPRPASFMPEGSHGQSDGLRSQFRASSTSMSKDSHSPRRVSPQRASLMPEGSRGQSDGLRSRIPRIVNSISKGLRNHRCVSPPRASFVPEELRDPLRGSLRAGSSSSEVSTVLCTVCRGDRPGLRRPCRRNRPVHRAGLGEHRFGRNRPRRKRRTVLCTVCRGDRLGLRRPCLWNRSVHGAIFDADVCGRHLPLGKRRAIDCAASGPALPGPRDARRVEAQCLGSGSLGQRADPAVRGRLWRMGIFRPPRWRRGGAGRDQSRQRQEDHPAP